MSRPRNATSFTSDRAREAVRRRWHPTPLRSDNEGGAPPIPRARTPRERCGEDPWLSGSDPDYRGLATNKLEALLESSSAIAALGAAKELLNRTASGLPWGAVTSTEQSKAVVVQRRG